MDSQQIQVDDCYAQQKLIDEYFPPKICSFSALSSHKQITPPIILSRGLDDGTDINHFAQPYIA
jgi:hypothetical protein